MGGRISILWLLSIEIFTRLFTSSSAQIPAIIVFGDSSVDSGNNNFLPTIAKCNFEPYGRDFLEGHPTGRFSNGRIAPDFISEAFGIKPTVPAYLDPAYNISDFATGVCFASGGSGYDNATSKVTGVIPLWKEVEYYKDYQNKLRAFLGEDKANEIIREAVYIISIGTNDFLENYYVLPERRCQFTVQKYQDFLIGIAENFFRQLYELGARKISVTGLPPMGCLPLERTINIIGFHGCVEKYNVVALEFNEKLSSLLTKLNMELPGIHLIDANVFNIFLEMITQPSSFGFDVARVGCCGTGRFEMSYLCDRKNPFTCTDANKFVFWDAFHPSERTSQILTNYALQTYLADFV